MRPKPSGLEALIKFAAISALMYMAGRLIGGHASLRAALIVGLIASATGLAASMSGHWSAK